MSSKVAVEKNAALQLYEQLRRRIIHLQIAPGTSLDEKSLVEQFNISRTPVREALIRLSADGLVELERNRSARVTSLDAKSLAAIFEAGDLIERACARLACIRRTDADIASLEESAATFETAMRAEDVSGMIDTNTRFHQSVADAADNRYLADSYSKVLADHERIAQLWYTHNFQRGASQINDDILAQHTELLRAIIDRDMKAADAVTVAHADMCKVGVGKLISGDADLFADLNEIPASVSI